MTTSSAALPTFLSSALSLSNDSENKNISSRASNGDNVLCPFELPELFSENPAGWGPGSLSSGLAGGNSSTTTASTLMREEFDGLPYQQFNKGDRVGRIVDWLGGDRYRRGEMRERYNERVYGSSATAGAQFDYVHDNEDASFQLVDSTKSQKPVQRGGYRRTVQFRRPLPQGRDYDSPYGQKLSRSVLKEQQKARKLWQRRGATTRGAFSSRTGAGVRRFGDRSGAKGRQPSIQVRQEWQVIEELDFQRLNKLYLPDIKPGQDIEGETYGTLYYYDKSIERVNVKQPILLERMPGTTYNLTTTDDPIIQKLASAGAGNVFATDMILATLMSASRSVNSWDIVAYRVGDKLFFDRRNIPGISPIDVLTVNETAAEPPPVDGPNNASDLATEAWFINQNFRRQVLLKSDRLNFKFANERVPFEDPKLPADSAYKYRTWNLGKLADGRPITLVARTEHDAVTLGTDGSVVQRLTIKCFNEWDCSQTGGMDWRHTLEMQKGFVLATEMKNNSFKMAKWIIQSTLAGSDYLKLGYVSRANMRNNTQHVILGTHQFRPTELAHAITLNLDNAWGVLRVIIEFFMKQPAGKYLLLKDPQQQVVRIYSLPQGTFDSSEDEDSEESSSSDGEGGN